MESLKNEDMIIGGGTRICTQWHEKLDNWVRQDRDFDEELHCSQFMES